MSSSTKSHKCAMCDTPSTLQCARCQAQYYCSAACQKSDWKIHKILCSTLQDFEVRPRETARRVIVFERDTPTIRFDWIDIETVHDDEDGDFHRPILEPLLGPKGFQGYGQQLFYNNVIRNRRVVPTCNLRFQEGFLNDRTQKVNQAVQRVAKANGKGDVWMGPLVVMKFESDGLGERWSGINERYYADIGMRDFRDVVDYLVVFGTR